MTLCSCRFRFLLAGGAEGVVDDAAGDSSCGWNIKTLTLTPSVCT